MIEIKKVRPGDYILYKNELYYVKSNHIVVTGTHSHAKNKLEMQGLFSGHLETAVFPPHERLEDVEIVRKKGQLIAKYNKNVQIMDMISYEIIDAEVIRKEILDKMNEGDEVTYIEFQGRSIVLDKR
ncbi:MAG: hypothetical protein QXK37_04725 [Candidatus Woesearchaeota archaeon]